METTTQEIVLTPHQEQGLNAILEWNNRPDDLFFTLIGSAGVGKTTVINHYIKKSKYKFSTVVSAPTHKAKKVIEKATKLESVTIQSLLGLRPNVNIDNFDINKPEFGQLAEPAISGHKVVIIDEASMLNKDLHELICKEAKRYKIKILFVGDAKQLPPVNEKMSVALSHPGVELTEIIRQKNTNPINGLLFALRNDIENGTESFFRLLRDVPLSFNTHEEGYELLSSEEYLHSIVSNFNSDSYHSDPNTFKLVSYTNESVNAWNARVRTARITLEDKITVGEILMAYNTVINKYNELVITNSADYIIQSVKKTTTEDFIPVYDCEAASESGQLTYFNIVCDEGIPDFLRFHDKYLNDAKRKKGRAWVDYYGFKAKYLLIKDIRDNAGKLIVKKDIDYGYALTVHKTQGSTYENVYVNLPDIMRCKDTIERKKLIYVAISRASKKVFLRNQI